MKILLSFIVAICFGCSNRASEPILIVENQSAESIVDVAATSYTLEAATRLDFEKAKKTTLKLLPLTQLISEKRMESSACK